jgi:hypothetical protein
MRMARRNTKSTVHSYCAKVSMFSCKKQAPQPDSGFAQSTPRVPLSLTSILISLSLPTCTYTLKRNRRDKTAHHQPSWDPTKKAKPWPLQNTGTAATRSQTERIPPTNGSAATKPSSPSSKRTCSRRNRPRILSLGSYTWGPETAYEWTDYAYIYYDHRADMRSFSDHPRRPRRPRLHQPTVPGLLQHGSRADGSNGAGRTSARWKRRSRRARSMWLSTRAPSTP